MKGFEKIIESLPATAKVLDIGCGGLDGENTSDYLIKRFGESNITGICRENNESKRYKELHPKLNLIFDNFYHKSFDTTYDIVVVDLNIENSLKDWSDKGLAKIADLLKPGGVYITYIMVTKEYGNPAETPALIENHWLHWWGEPIFSLEAIGNKLNKLDGWEVYETAQEERRSYILWVALRKK